jgi:hypothetical protein
VYRNRATLLLIVDFMINNISHQFFLFLCQIWNLSSTPSTMTTIKEINHSIEPPKKKPKKSKGISDTVVVKKEKDDEKNKSPTFIQTKMNCWRWRGCLQPTTLSLDAARSWLLFGRMYTPDTPSSKNDLPPLKPSFHVLGIN